MSKSFCAAGGQPRSVLCMAARGFLAQNREGRATRRCKTWAYLHALVYNIRAVHRLRALGNPTVCKNIFFKKTKWKRQNKDSDGLCMDATMCCSYLYTQTRLNNVDLRRPDVFIDLFSMAYSLRVLHSLLSSPLKNFWRVIIHILENSLHPMSEIFFVWPASESAGVRVRVRNWRTKVQIPAARDGIDSRAFLNHNVYTYFYIEKKMPW